MTTKRPGAKPAGAREMGATRHATAKAAFTKTGSAKAAPGKTAGAAAHILSAAKGPRTVSHRQIEKAVDKVFRERLHARA